MRFLLRSLLAGAVFGVAAFGGLLVAQQFTSSVQQSQDPRGNIAIDTNGNLYVQNNLHFLSFLGNGSQPVLSACTGGALSATSTDMSGSIATFTGTTCTVTFAKAFATAPACNVNTSTSANGQITVTTTTSTLVFTVGTGSSTTAKYICIGNT